VIQWGGGQPPTLRPEIWRLRPSDTQGPKDRSARLSETEGLGHGLNNSFLRWETGKILPSGGFGRDPDIGPEWDAEDRILN